MQFLFFSLALALQTPQTSEQAPGPLPSPQQPVTNKVVPQATPPIKSTPQASSQQEVLGPDQQVYIAQFGGYCVGQQILKGSPEEVGRWRVKYKVSAPEGNYTYRASGTGAQGYVSAHGSFLNWLNSTRASYGLPAVGYDPNLEAWAAQNNAQQSARGLGHYIMGPARRQNAAMGSFPGIESMWLASPGHRAALLDPTISFIGLAGTGAWWTFNAY